MKEEKQIKNWIYTEDLMRAKVKSVMKSIKKRINQEQIEKDTTHCFKRAAYHMCYSIFGRMRVRLHAFPFQALYRLHG